jgi:exonuclease VII small subunit
VPLDELMKLYEEGVGHLRACNEQLDTAEQKVKMLHISPDGKTAHLEPFSEEDEA